MKTNFGIIVLLDALGTRTAHIDQANKYLSHLKELKSDAMSVMEIYIKRHPLEKQSQFKKLSITYFGDTVLLSYRIVDRTDIFSYIRYLYCILNYFFLFSIERKILFRGAISIGEYIQQQNVVLGPALTDAALWHDSAEIIGAYATPQTTRIIDYELDKTRPQETSSGPPRFNGFRYPIPFKNNKQLDLFAVDWPSVLDFRSRQLQFEKEDRLKVFHSLMHSFSTPPGTEQKYLNTESFVRHALDRKSKKP